MALVKLLDLLLEFHQVFLHLKIVEVLLNSQLHLKLVHFQVPLQYIDAVRESDCVLKERVLGELLKAFLGNHPCVSFEILN